MQQDFPGCKKPMSADTTNPSRHKYSLCKLNLLSVRTMSQTVRLVQLSFNQFSQKQKHTLHNTSVGLRTTGQDEEQFEVQ